MVTCTLCFIGCATIHIMDIIDENRKEDTAGLLIVPILYVIFHLVWVFIIFNLGQHFKDMSEAVFYKANETSWYLLSKQSKILLFMIILRASKPSYVSVGNMFVASNESFAQLLRLSMSYAMVLHSSY
ncbi:hypothetical protein M0804_007075 [Polistes exclamans]|nr:hypothetical protein M0804_007075 [Polistes exclamans]